MHPLQPVNLANVQHLAANNNILPAPRISGFLRQQLTAANNEIQQLQTDVPHLQQQNEQSQQRIDQLDEQHQQQIQQQIDQLVEQHQQQIQQQGNGRGCRGNGGRGRENRDQQRALNVVQTGRIVLRGRRNRVRGNCGRGNRGQGAGQN